MVNVVSELRIEVTDRIVRKRGEMDYSVEASQVCRSQVAKVLGQLGNSRHRLPEITLGEEIGVEADHFVASGLENGRRNSADISLVTGQEYAHEFL